MKINFLILTLTLTSVMLISGCTEEQMQNASTMINDANNISSAIGGVIASPAGTFLPVSWKVILLLATNLISAGTAVYNKWQKDNIKVVAKAIVQGVEATKAVDLTSAKSVTNNIEAEMIDQEILAKGNVIVEQLKNA